MCLKAYTLVLNAINVIKTIHKCDKRSLIRKEAHTLLGDVAPDCKKTHEDEMQSSCTRSMHTHTSVNCRPNLCAQETYKRE